MNEAHVDILVGFKGGQQHHMVVHRNKPKEEFRDLEGKTPDQVTPIDVDELAKMQHFGTANIPARPFLTDGIRQNLGKIKRAMQDEAKKIADGKKPNWDKVGQMAVGAIQEFVKSDYYKSRKPNSATTIKYKGSDIPLIDSAEMLNSMSYLVQRQK